VHIVLVLFKQAELLTMERLGPFLVVSPVKRVWEEGIPGEQQQSEEEATRSANHSLRSDEPAMLESDGDL